MSYSERVQPWSPAAILPDRDVAAASSDSARPAHLRRPARAFRLGPTYELVVWDLLVVWDAAAMPAAAVVAAVIGSLVVQGASAPISWTWPELPLSLVGTLLVPLMLYSRDRPLAASQTVVRTLTLFLLLMAIAAFTGSFWSLSPVRVILWFTLAAATMVLGRTLVDKHLSALRHRGLLGEHVAIVGVGALSERLRRELTGRSNRPVRIAGVFEDSVATDGYGAPAGGLRDLIELGRRWKLDSIYLAGSRASGAGQPELLRYLMALDAEIFAVADDSAETRHLYCDLLVPRPIRGWGAVLKTLEDRVLALFLLIVLAPVLLGCAFAVWLEGSGGPVIFRQRRHGLGNTEFDILKFRTMVWEGAAAADGATQTTRGDPRITAVGAFLRRTSLDELPQLLNVLTGQMSIVGPRPHPVAMRTQGRLCEEFAEDYAHRHRVKPGITGWAQINGCRGAADRPEQLLRRLLYDLDYVARWSLLFDLKILLLTPWSLVAYRSDAF